MILVTGATGHIGNVLVRMLVARGESVRALLLPGEDRTPIVGLDLEIVEGDVLAPKSLRRAMEGIRIVYHLAGLISILPGRNALVHEVNVTGTRNVLRAAEAEKVARLIYTSSIHAIAPAGEDAVIDEGLPFDASNAASAYDLSKAEASLSVLEAAQRGLDAVILCPTGVVGPYDYRFSQMGRLIYDAMRLPFHLSVPGAYDFVDVRDVASGLIQACESGRQGEHYILGGEQISVSRLLALVREATGLNSLHIPVPGWIARAAAWLASPIYRLTRIPPRLTTYALDTLATNARVSYAKAKRELGYRPRRVRQSIADTVAWFEETSRGKPDTSGAPL